MSIINTVVQGGGTTPTGTLQITTNGTHDVTNYATADVQVPTTAPAHYIEYQTTNGLLKPSITAPLIDFTGATKIDSYALYTMYSNNVISGIIDMSNITEIRSFACYSTFSNCAGITGVNLGSLTTLPSSVSGGSNCGYMFNGCYNLVSADLHSLTTISGASACANMFKSCPITSIDLSSLTSITGGRACESMFYGDRFAEVDFPSLETMSGSYCLTTMFRGSPTLTRVSFYALTPSSFGTQTTQFNNMLQNVTGCTVHFPMAVQSTIGSWADVTNGFGGTNTTVLFDIVTTLTGADSNSYTRKQKESTSTATAWTYNDTLYYTSGTTEPAVSDTIYSDAACTTAVTTISAIS